MPETPDIIVLISSVLLGLSVLLLGLWIGPAWDALARRRIKDLAPQLEELSLDQSQIPFYLRLWGIALFGSAFVFAIVLRMPLFAPVIVYVVYISPRYFLQMWIERRRKLLRDQMVGASVTLANAARAGLSLAQGLEAISKEVPEPLSAELRRLVWDYHRGRPLEDAIRDTKDRLNLDGFTLFANAILSCLERGGRVTEALERISKSLQENQRLERKLDADTASGRRVILILGLFPIGFLIGFYLLDPVTTSLLFETIIGQVVLVIIAAMVYSAVIWAKQILSIDM